MSPSHLGIYVNYAFQVKMLILEACQEEFYDNSFLEREVIFLYLRCLKVFVLIAINLKFALLGFLKRSRTWSSKDSSY